MSDSFPSSEDYSDRAHQLYNEGAYDEAVELLRQALEIYPLAAELHVGMGYARLAREEYAWARLGFEQALGLNPTHEEALAGLGEVLLKLGQRAEALSCFEKVLNLGFREDHDLVLQMGRALFREQMFHHARGFFEIAASSRPDSAEAAACVGYAMHRSGEEESALYWLRRALDLDPDYCEARIYLANLLYDRGEYEASLVHFEQTDPQDHTDELGLWRVMELKRSLYHLAPGDPELLPWEQRLEELEAELDEVERLLLSVETTQPDGSVRDPNQLELFGTLLVELEGMRRRSSAEVHRVLTASGVSYTGTWEEIVLQMKMDDREWSGVSLSDYMEQVARRSRLETGIVIPATDAESFVRGSAAAGLLKILK